MKAKILAAAFKEIVRDPAMWALMFILTLCGLDAKIGFKMAFGWLAIFMILCLVVQSGVVKNRDKASK